MCVLAHAVCRKEMTMNFMNNTGDIFGIEIIFATKACLKVEAWFEG